MSYHVLIHEDVAERLLRLDEVRRVRIVKAIGQLGVDPFNSRPGADIRKLRVPQDRAPLYRLRVGEYRAILVVEEDIVLVTELVHRRQAYRRL